jgi:hypothetical protein
MTLLLFLIIYSCPTHTKSFLRRATARSALGKYRAALQDLLQAEQLDPADKSIKGELGKTRELLRSAVNRAPLIPVEVNFVDEISAPEQGPELPMFVDR